MRPMARTAQIQSLPLRSANASEKDVPLRNDIRLLGRILGDTVREQEGEEVFALVEQIRKASVRFHRHNEVGARRELEATLDSLTADQTLAIVRAYSYFSHLANIAEDQHHIRRNRAHVVAGSAPRPGTMAHALKRAREAGTDAKALRAFFDGALVSPLPPPHPPQPPVLIRLHFLQGAATHLRGDRGRAGAPDATRQGQGSRLLLAGRLMDRRRSRRQSLCDR